jgi:hypothetical protein
MAQCSCNPQGQGDIYLPDSQAVPLRLLRHRRPGQAEPLAGNCLKHAYRSSPRLAKPRGWWPARGGVLCMSLAYITAQAGDLSFLFLHFGHSQIKSSSESIISGGK